MSNKEKRSRFSSKENQIIWNSISSYFSHIQSIDYTKLDRQILAIRKFIGVGGRGAFEACTGFGKTIVLIIAIIRMNIRVPTNRIIVIVPNTNLYNDWCDPNDGYISVFKLKNVKVYVVNTYTMDFTHRVSRECEFLALDEGHRYANEDSQYFSTVLKLTKFKYLLVLSATLGNKEKKFFENYGVKVFDTVTVEEAENKGWISNYIMYNLGVALTDEDRKLERKLTDSHNAAFAYFDFDYRLATACNVANEQRYYHPFMKMSLTGRQWREKVAIENETTPEVIRQKAGLWFKYMTERQSFLHQASNKTDAVEEILNKLPYKSIVFSQYTDIVKDLALRLGSEAREYHSKVQSTIFESEDSEEIVAVKQEKGPKYRTLSGKLLSYKEIKAIYPNCKRYSANNLKAKIKKDFAEDKFRILLTSKALDEGYNQKDIVLGILHSGSSKQIQFIQRIGRILRAIEGKIAMIINVYVKDTQDEKWLKSRIKGIAPSKIRWVDSVDEIELLSEENYDVELI